MSDWPDIFLAHLEQTANVSAAARAALVNRDTPYERRKTHPEFASAWDRAMEAAVDTLEAEARRRAMDYSDHLMMFLLKAHRPLKYRENIKHEHEGDLTIRVEYADANHLAPQTSSGSSRDPEGL